ncbi:concanavalin A-like lectin/glucanase domain-containing protein [Dissophora ornata]|nr:concanavalin A-like lectin/glucanase domain-containing protein [Dissophora ornata]
MKSIISHLRHKAAPGPDSAAAPSDNSNSNGAPATGGPPAQPIHPSVNQANSTEFFESLALTAVEGGPTVISADEPNYPLLSRFIIPDEKGPDRRNCNYKRKEVQTTQKGTSISIGRHSTLKPFSCGELIFKRLATYGTYTVDIIPSSVLGHVTGFFLIAGDSSEIDIEFTGADSTVIWLNVWKGKDQHPVKIPLGFDAAQGWHTYTIEWRREFIAWYVDGREVLRQSAVDTADPSTTQYKLALNSWTSNSDTPWAGKFVWPGENVKVQSMFRNLRYTP